MNRILVFLAGLLLAAGPMRGEEAKPDKPQSASEQFKAILEEYSKGQQDFFKKYSEAKSDEERSKAVEARPNPEGTGRRLLEFAAKTTDEGVAADSLVWIVANVRSGELPDKALGQLSEKYIKSEKLGSVCTALVYSDSPQAEAFLRNALEKSPHRSVQGPACYALAQFMKQQSELMDQLKNRPELAARYAEMRGKEAADRLASRDPKQIAAEIESLLGRIVQSYGDLAFGNKTLGQAAERELFEIQHLSVGCVAPEIDGEGIDGQKLRLSDYRGKVVMLDFWGNW